VRFVYHLLLRIAPPDFCREYAHALWLDLSHTFVEQEELHGVCARTCSRESTPFS
jgi:hypothetical protein